MLKGPVDGTRRRIHLRGNVRLPLSIALAALASSCALLNIRDTSTSASFTQSSNIPTCAVDRVGFVKPVVSLSVGISDYLDERWPSTPAHSLGAHITHEALTRTKIGENSYLEATVRLKPDTFETRSALALLVNVSTIARNKLGWFSWLGQQHEDQPVWQKAPKLNDDGTRTYLGSGENVTRARLSALVRGVSHRAQQIFTEKREVVLVIYIASHGVIGPDGIPYVIPADAKQNDVDSWMSFSEILEPVIEFLERDGNDDLSKQAVVIFDSCQVLEDRSAAKLMSSELPPPPPGLSVVSSASPGQLAWHYASKVKMAGRVTSSTRGLFHIPLSSDVPAGKIKVDLSGYMSVFPLALKCGMNTFVKSYDEKIEKDPNAGETFVTVDDWLSVTKDMVTELLEDDPLVRASGRSQDIQMEIGEPFGKPVLVVRP